MSRTERLKGYLFFIINYKLNSRASKGDEDYIRLTQKVFDEKLKFQLRGTSYGFIRRLYPMKIGDRNYFFGKFSKFTVIEEKEWIDLSKREVVEFEIPRDLFPNLVETDFIVVPEAHRIVVFSTPKISPNLIVKFFKLALESVKGETEEVIVTLEQSQDVFDEIFDAEIVKSLEISISYTNDDITKDAEKWMDRQLKEAGLNNLSMKATPDSKGKINVNTQLISGALKLAKSNGNATANIVTKSGKKKKIITRQHPRFEEVKANVNDEISILAAVVDFIRRVFRLRVR